MDKISVLFPVFALVFLTIYIGLWLGKLRWAAVKRGDLNPGFYKLNRGGKLPDYLAKVSHNYDNLLEFPILFYILTIWLFVTDNVEIAQVVMAWVFVVSRYMHSYIHTTFNDVRLRGKVFMVGVVVVIVMWILFFVRVLQS